MLHGVADEVEVVGLLREPDSFLRELPCLRDVAGAAEELRARKPPEDLRLDVLVQRGLLAQTRVAVGLGL